MFNRLLAKLAAVAVLSTFTLQVFAENTRPNIVVILLDDLGYADVGFMEHAESDIYTPNIDQIASEGAVLSAAYVTHPFCGPSRAGLMTGRNQHEFGAQFNLAAYSEHGVDVNETFFSKVLQESDYKTALIGKWHLGEELQYQPSQRGFDYFYGMLGGGHRYFTDNFTSVAGHTPKTGWDYNAPLTETEDGILGYASETGYGDNLYITDMLTDAGVKFIDDAQGEDDKPFMLFMSYNAPHTPEEAKESDKQALELALGNNAATGKRLTYTAMVYAVDRGVKKLVDKLKATGEYNNTMIVFFSDNGGRESTPSNTNVNAMNTPLRGVKGDTFEGGIRVPMFISWPDGNIPSGTYDHPVSSLDLYPTFISMAGESKPEGKELDGKNILEHLKNNTNARPTEPLFFMRHDPNANNGGGNRTSVILNHHKWFNDGSGTWEYFDLANDIEEEFPKTELEVPEQTHLIDSVYQWTQSHIRPIFFDDENRYGFEAGWDRNQMPNFVKTFPGRYDEVDYLVKPTPMPTPTPETTPSPAVSPAPESTPSPQTTAMPEATPTPEAMSTPVPSVTTAPVATPAPAPKSGGSFSFTLVLAALTVFIRRRVNVNAK